MIYFIALDVSTEISNYLFSIQNQFLNVELLNLTDSFHITLKFLGDIRVNEVITNLSKIKVNKFSLSLLELGAFPDNKSAKVIWVGLNDEPMLFKLQSAVDKATNFIKSDFDFHPHITLARAKQKLTLPLIQIKKLNFRVNNFVLYQSQLSHNGVKYLKIKKFDLL